MKRLFILVTAIIALGSTSFASNGEYAAITKLDSKETLNGISSYLQVNFSQKEDLKEIFALTAKKMKRAASNGNLSEADTRKVMAFNLANTRSILSPEQYKKYLIVLNISVNNMNNRNLFAEK